MINNNIYTFRSVETELQIVCINNHRVTFLAGIGLDNLDMVRRLLSIPTGTISRGDIVRAIYESTIFDKF